MSPENIEEIINDTFMVIWMRAKDFRHESKVCTWIFGIAYRTAMKQLRRPRHVSSLQLVGDLPESGDPARDIDMQVSLSCAFALLPLEQRITLMLPYQLRYPVRQIPPLTSSPPRTANRPPSHARA